MGLNIDDPVWDPSTFSFNRQRLFDEAIAPQFFEHTVLLARLRDLVSDEHFSVDGTLLKVWASHMSFRPKDDDEGDGDDFHGHKRSNDTQDFVAALRTPGIVAHIARNTDNGRRSAVPRAVARTGDYAISQKVRKRIEQGFGWIKTIGRLRKLPMAGLRRAWLGDMDVCRL